MKSPEPSQPVLGAADWIGVALVGMGVLFLVQFPFLVAPAFERMFHDFGSVLPVPTALALTKLPLLLALVCVAMLAIGLGPWLSMGYRRLLIVASFLFCCVFSALCLWAMYMPLFVRVGEIR